MAKKQHNTMTMPPRNSASRRAPNVEPPKPAEQSGVPHAADDVAADIAFAEDIKTQVADCLKNIEGHEDGLITIPIKVALLEPKSFIGPVRLSFDADGERARTIQRLQTGLNAYNLRKGNGKHVASIAGVVEYLLDQVAACYAAETQTEADDDGLRTYHIEIAVMEPPTVIRPITVWYKGHGLQAKTLQRLRIGLDGYHLRLNDNRHVESYESVVRYLIDQVQLAIGNLSIQQTLFSATEELAMNGVR